MTRDEAVRELDRLAREMSAHRFEVGKIVDLVIRHQWWQEWSTARGIETFETFGAWCQAVFDAASRRVRRWVEAYRTLKANDIRAPSRNYDLAIQVGFSKVICAGYLADGNRDAFIALLNENPSHRDLQYRLGYGDRRTTAVVESSVVYVVRRTMRGGRVGYLTSRNRFVGDRQRARTLDTIDLARSAAQRWTDAIVLSVSTTVRVAG